MTKFNFMNNQKNNLDTFKILFLIKGILTLCFSLFFLIYAGIGIFFTEIIENTNTAGSIPFNPGYIFLIIGMVGFLFSLTLGILSILTSKYIKEQRNYTFIFVLAIINGITGILGILLAVFTIIELSKPHIKELFGKNNV